MLCGAQPFRWTIEGALGAGSLLQWGLIKKGGSFVWFVGSWDPPPPPFRGGAGPRIIQGRALSKYQLHPQAW